MKYWGNFRIAFKQGMSSVALNLVWVLSKITGITVAVIVWSSVYNYSNTGVIQGFTVDQTINYMIFNALFVWTLTYNNMSRNIGKSVKNGDLSTKLLRPVDYAVERLFDNLGNRLYATIFELLPSVIIAVLFFNFTQYNPLMTILSFVSIFMAFLINFFFSIIWAFMYFFTIEYGSFEWLKNLFTDFLSGVFMPLNFFPEAFQKVVKFLPFQFTSYIPARIYINSYSINEVIQLLLVQALWVLILYTIYKLGWRRIIKKFSGVGI